LLDSSLSEMDSRKLAVAKTLREDASINTITSHIARFSMDKPKTLKHFFTWTACQMRHEDIVERYIRLTHIAIASTFFPMGLRRGRHHEKTSYNSDQMCGQRES
jgi:hypothetical protein